MMMKSAVERNNRRRHHKPPRRAGREHRAPPIPLTADGVPAAVPDAPPLSPVVFVSDESLARYPWLPGRVIAGSVWRGPQQFRVRVDEHGDAQPWRSTVASAR